MCVNTYVYICKSICIYVCVSTFIYLWVEFIITLPSPLFLKFNAILGRIDCSLNQRHSMPHGPCGCDSKRGGPPIPWKCYTLSRKPSGGGGPHICIYIYIAILYLHAIMRHRNQPSIDTYTVDTMGNQW